MNKIRIAGPIARLFSTPPAAALIILALVFAGGCSGIKTDFQERNLFRIKTPATAPGQTTRGKGLLVRRFGIAPEFEPSSFVYQVSQSRFVGDYYNKFMVPPARMISDAVKEGLISGPLFRPVPMNDPGAIQYRLWGKVTELYGDLRDPDRPVAVMGIRMVLEQQGEKGFSPVINRDYSVKQSLAAGSEAPGLVEGWNRCLEEILIRFSTDVRAAW